MSDDYAASSSTTGTLVAGSSASGAIETSGDEDWFAISLTAGTGYTFSLNGSTLSDPYLSLYDANGSWLESNDDYLGYNSQITYTPTSTGTYYLGSRGYGAATGTYQILFSSGSSGDDYRGSTSTAGTISIGGSRTGTIETSGDEDWFAISLTAGTGYTFNLNGSTLSDPYLSLYDANGSWLGSNDDYNGLDSQIAWTATTSGTYYLAARGLGDLTGTYTLLASSGSSTGIDDYAANTSTTGTISSGGSRTGFIETSGDHDWFAISLTAGTAYIFNLNAAGNDGLSDPYLSLYSSSGSLLASNDDYSGLNSQLTYTPTTSGTFYLDASDYVGSVGAYSLLARGGTVSDDHMGNTSTTSSISLGGSLTGNIEAIGDQDWFSISLSANQRYVFSLTPSLVGGISYPYLSVYDSQGRYLSGPCAVSESNVETYFSPSASGTYYLAVNDYGGATGGYTIASSTGTTVADDYVGNSATSGYVFAGGQRVGRIDTAGDHDWFAISLTAGQTYTLTLNSSTLSDPCLSLYDSGGSLLASNDDYIGLNSLITYTAASSGTYYLDASGIGSATGTYVLLATVSTSNDDFADSTSTTGTASPGAGGNSGTIETSGDEDWFAVSLAAGTNYTFNLNGGSLSDPYLILYDSRGSWITSNDDFDGLDSQITWTATTTGTYYLSASGYGSATGTYTLLVGAGATSDDYAGSTTTTGHLIPGASRTGSLESSGDQDWFAVSLTAGQSYTFNLTGATLTDPYLRLYNSSGSLLDSNDDYIGTDSQITYTPTSSGTYYLGASGYGTTMGTYALSASSATTDDFNGSISTTEILGLGESRTGNIETIGDQDWFAINLTAGQSYSFDLNGATLDDPYLSLYGSNGTWLASNDDTNGLDSQVIWTARTTGTYYLAARGYGSATGSYTLHAASGTGTDDYAGNSSTAGTVSLGSSSTGTIEASYDEDWFAVSLAAGETYTFSLRGNANSGLSDPYLGLYNRSGTLLVSNDDYQGLNSQITWTSSAAETYYLSARGFGTATGGYTLYSSAGRSGDDFTASTATAGSITMGSSRGGTIETSGDQDWFAISLMAGSSYIFNLDGTTLCDPYLRVFNATGTLIASNDDYNGLDSRIGFAPTATGTYYLSAGGYGTGTGGYTLYATQSLGGDESNNSIIGGPGDDYINGGAGDDALSGGDGTDTAIYQNALAAVSIDLSTRTVRGGDGNDTVTGFENVLCSQFADQIIGDSGNNEIDGSGGADRMSGGAGSDTYYVDNTGDRVIEENNDSTSTSTAISQGGVTSSVGSNIDRVVASIDYALTSFIENLQLSGNATSGTGNELDNAIAGNALANTLSGMAGDDTLTGGDGNDSLDGGAGDDSLDGGSGLDTATYAGNNSSYIVTATGSGYTVTDSTGSTGVDTLANVERLAFADASIALDIAGNRTAGFDVTGLANAGQVYRLYQAAFNRAPDATGLTYWVAQADASNPLCNIATSFTSGREFQNRYGSLSDHLFIDQLYQNVLHRAGEAAGAAYWYGQLDTAAMTREQILVGFSESTENQAAVIGVIGNGISY